VPRPRCRYKVTKSQPRQYPFNRDSAVLLSRAVVVDRKASIVRLIHFTLQEYLRAHAERFATAHSTIAETCLSYLNSQQVRALLTSPSPDLPDTPFLEYSSIYWGVHAKQNLSYYGMFLALRLFDGHNIHIPIKILLEARGHFTYGIDSYKLCVLNGLHWASLFGIDGIVAILAMAGRNDTVAVKNEFF